MGLGLDVVHNLALELGEVHLVAEAHFNAQLCHHFSIGCTNIRVHGQIHHMRDKELTVGRAKVLGFRLRISLLGQAHTLHLCGSSEHVASVGLGKCSELQLIGHQDGELPEGPLARA